jgi:hypothetical protein
MIVAFLPRRSFAAAWVGGLAILWGQQKRNLPSRDDEIFGLATGTTSRSHGRPKDRRVAQKT